MPKQHSQANRWRQLGKVLVSGAVVIAAASVVAGTLRRRPAVEAPSGVTSRYQVVGFQRTLQQLNQDLRGEVEASGLQTAPPADSLTLARRVSLALVGSGLSLEEVRAISNVPQERRLNWITEYLLDDQRWADYFAERFARSYVGTNNGQFLLFRRRKFNAWLSEQFAESRPYDKIVAQMISAEGLWTDTPQVNFITATMDEANDGRADPVRLAGRVSRAFLAQRIDCVQCHDDFIGTLALGEADDVEPGAQEHFHELAAFFAGTALPKAVFRGLIEDGKEYKFEFLNAEDESTVAPQVPFARDLFESKGKPREQLAAWVTHPQNLAFSRATVNRVWALLLARPLVDPVDNIPLYEPVPAALDTLAKDFSAHGFNLKRLVRLIVQSDAFQRDSRAEFEVTTEHEDCWAVYPITQMRPDQVSASISQACQLTAIDDGSSIVAQLRKFGESQDFLKRFGDRGEDEFDSEAVTISQRLVLMNGNLVAERTKNDLVSNAASRIAVLVADDEGAVEVSFLAVLNRMPSENEKTVYVEHLAGTTGGQRVQALSDIFWAMINSTEFSWNH